MSIFNEEQIRQAIDNFQKTHPVAFAYDISRFDNEESLGIIRSEIDRLSKKAEKDSEMHIIFEMAKQYLNGARPSYDRKKGKWHIRQRGLGYSYYQCSECRNVIDACNEQFENGEFRFCDKCGAEMTID